MGKILKTLLVVIAGEMALDWSLGKVTSWINSARNRLWGYFSDNMSISRGKGEYFHALSDNLPSDLNVKLSRVSSDMHAVVGTQGGSVAGSSIDWLFLRLINNNTSTKFKVRLIFNAVMLKQGYPYHEGQFMSPAMLLNVWRGVWADLIDVKLIVKDADGEWKITDAATIPIHTPGQYWGTNTSITNLKTNDFFWDQVELITKGNFIRIADELEERHSNGPIRAFSYQDQKASYAFKGKPAKNFEVGALKDKGEMMLKEAIRTLDLVNCENTNYTDTQKRMFFLDED